MATMCSGIGSPEQAIHELSEEEKFELQNVFACDIDKYARLSYLANFNTDHMYHDMTAEKWDQPNQYADIVVAGIPCQAFSLAGKRLGELDPRGLLFFDFYRYLKNQQPKVFIIENVKGLLSDNKGITFQNWCWLLSRSENHHEKMFPHPDSLEYNIHYTVLNSKDFGVPQNRERVFIVGIRKDLPNEFRFPKGFKLEKRLKDVLEENVDEKYYLSEKAINSIILNPDNLQKPNINPEIAATIQCPGNSCGTYKGANFVTDEPVCVAMRGRYDENKKVNQQLEVNSEGITNSITTVQKDNLIIEPELVQVAQLPGFDSEGRVYDSNGISRTLKNGGGGGSKTGWYLVEVKNGKQYYFRIRRLTPLECWRLQGFPDINFIKASNVNSDTQLYKQSGNSMTKHVMKAIIKNTLSILLK